MTIVSERLGTIESEGPLPEVTRELVEDEVRRRQFLSDFGDRALAALEEYADQRERAGMGPQNPTVSHAYWDRFAKNRKRLDS